MLPCCLQAPPESMGPVYGSPRPLSWHVSSHEAHVASGAAHMPQHEARLALAHCCCGPPCSSPACTHRARVLPWREHLYQRLTSWLCIYAQIVRASRRRTSLTSHSAMRTRQGRTTSLSACEAPPSRASQVCPMSVSINLAGTRLPLPCWRRLQSAMVAAHACEADGLRLDRRCCPVPPL